ncbi:MULTISPECIES: hypothetical protein [Anaerofustis]|uniref:hypothetical protein n=1 Tax=Anaerofustis TaxID=264995 RepID=UPI0011071B96|nr:MULTISPECIES: hypothetical protein [Anaerofustis]MCO8193006.1 hypothetical protein [Anaerofustis sp. NSJ-163]
MDKLIGFDEDVRNIEPLGDTPMISGEELRQTFDKAGVDIKEYLNSVLLPKVNDEIIENIDTNTTNIEKIKTDMESITNRVDNTIAKIYVGESTSEAVNTSPKIVFSKTVPTTSNYGANLPIGSIVFVY